MLQSLAEKESTYTHKWGLRRVVFEPKHRYFFYSEVLDHHIKETDEVQKAIADCRDLHTTWKHKIKVTKVMRDVQLHHPPSEAILQTEDFDVRKFYILHVEGHRRKIQTEGFDKFTTAVHAAFDEASPIAHRSKKGEASEFEKKLAAAIHHELADEDELSLSYNDRDSTPTRYTFRFLSQAVFVQWFETFTKCLERDEVTDTKYSVDCPKVDPRCNVPIARVPLHLTNTMHVLDQFIFYALLRGTRIVLNEAQHDPHNYSAVSLGEVDHLHLLRYEDAARYNDPTFLLLTDNVVYFVRKDGKVIWTLNLIDVEAVWFNTTATPEPFIVFKNRPPLADLVFLVFHDPDRRGPAGYYDSTLYGPMGAKFFVDVLQRLAPHAAGLRARGEKAVLSAPALRQKLWAGSPQRDNNAVGSPSTLNEPVKPFACIGMNIYNTFEEFVREEAANITWRASPDVVASVSTGRASAMPHVQVAPTPRWKLTKAIQARTKQLAAATAATKLHDAAVAAKSSSEARRSTSPQSTSAPPSPPPAASLLASPSHNNASPVLAHPDAAKMPKVELDGEEDMYGEVVEEVTKVVPPPPPPPSKRLQLAVSPTGAADSPSLGTSAVLNGSGSLQRKQSTISKVMLTPLQLPRDGDSSVPTEVGPQTPPAQIPAPRSGEDLLGLFSPKLLPRSARQAAAATTATDDRQTNSEDGIVLEDSFDSAEDDIDEDDL